MNTRYRPTNVAIKKTNGRVVIVMLEDIRSSAYIGKKANLIELEMADGSKIQCFPSENWRLVELLGW